ncbi:MAG: hypothetical protein ACK5SR_01525, partial [Burkholderiales bacterium]
RWPGLRFFLAVIPQSGASAETPIGATVMLCAVSFPKHLKMDIFTNRFNFQTPAILTEQITREPH